MSETYGTLTDVLRDSETIVVGESTSCAVSFTATAREIQNSNWMMNGQNAAVRFGQLAS